MRNGIPFLFLLVTQQLFAQVDTVEVSEAESKKFRYQHRAAYASVAYDLIPIFGGFEPAITISGGVQYRQFLLGATWSDFDVTVQQRIIFPNFFDLRMRHAGLYVGYQFWHTRQLSADFLMQYSVGDAVWTSVGTGEDTFRDELSFLTPQLQMQYTPTRYTWLFVSAGYRQAMELELAATDASDLSGLTVSFGLKLGMAWRKPYMIITDKTDE